MRCHGDYSTVVGTPKASLVFVSGATSQGSFHSGGRNFILSLFFSFSLFPTLVHPDRFGIKTMPELLGIR